MPSARRRPTVQLLALAILLAAAAIALLPRVALSFYSFPSADDYCIVAETRNVGFWPMQLLSYLTWTGRFSAVFFESAASQFDLLGSYPWISLSTLLLTLAAIRAVVASVIGDAVSSLLVTAIAFVVAAVFVDGLPSTVEAFYWMPGAASYQWGIITYLVWLSLLIRRVRRRGGHEPPVWQAPAILMLTAVLPGFNEVSAPVVFATIGGFMLANRWKNGSDDRFLLTVLGIAVLLTALSFAAPGNANRSNSYPALESRHNLQYAVVETARQTVRYLLNFGRSPILWLGAFMAWWWGDRVLAGRFDWLRRPASVAAVVLALVSVLYLTLFPLSWEYGEVNYTGEGRTYNVTYLVLCAVVLTVAGALAHAARPLRERVMNIEPRRRWVALAAPGLLAVLLVASASTRQVYQALNVAPDYLKEERARARVLREAPREGVVFVDGLTVKPAGLFWGDLEPDQSHWINICVARYYKLEFVRSRL